MSVAGDPTYVVLIGDLVASKRLPDRGAIQERLEATLESLRPTLRNPDESGCLVPPMITVGDEFQALFTRGEPVVDLMRRIRAAMWPIQISCGVGHGTIATPVRPDAIGRMDGPAFHAARDALVIRKGSGGTAFAGFGTHPSNVLTALYAGWHGIARRWTARQVEVMERARDGGTQAEMATDLGITQAAVSDALAAAGFDYVRSIEASLRDVLSAQAFGHDRIVWEAS